MKNLIIIALVCFFCTSCDPVASMEATIENTTQETLVIDFVAFNANENRTITIKSSEVFLFQEGFDIGATYLEPSLSEFDSVIVRNLTQEVLKIYKSDDVTKSIYRLNNWISSEPSKRYFKYNYKIENSDFK